MDKFYVLELTDTKGKKGYLMEKNENGFMVSEGGITPDVRQFESPKHANKFLMMNKKKLKMNRIKYAIKSNEQLIEEGVNGITSTADMDLWYLEDVSGQKLHYNEEEEGYFFQSGEVGYCVFDDEDKLKEMVKEMNLSFEVFIKKLEKPKK